MIQAPNLLDLKWLDHGFGLRDSELPAGVRTVKQIHSRIVLDVEEWSSSDDAPAPEGDALISDRAGIRVGIRTADCVPILLVDPAIPVVAAIHAGWRGSAENIAAAAVSELSNKWKTRPGNLRAAIGPSIGACCYEVGAEVANRFETWNPQMRQAQGPVHLDLRAINEEQLRAAGVRDIWRSEECTFCLPRRFFSFRREREQAGRMLSFIGLQKHVGRTA
jgi:YfiH family protein